MNNNNSIKELFSHNLEIVFLYCLLLFIKTSNPLINIKINKIVVTLCLNAFALYCQ